MINYMKRLLIIVIIISLMIIILPKNCFSELFTNLNSENKVLINLIKEFTDLRINDFENKKDKINEIVEIYNDSQKLSETKDKLDYFLLNSKELLRNEFNINNNDDQIKETLMRIYIRIKLSNGENFEKSLEEMNNINQKIIMIELSNNNIIHQGIKTLSENINEQFLKIRLEMIENIKKKYLELINNNYNELDFKNYINDIFDKFSYDNIQKTIFNI